MVGHVLMSVWGARRGKSDGPKLHADTDRCGTRVGFGASAGPHHATLTRGLNRLTVGVGGAADNVRLVSALALMDTR